MDLNIEELFVRSAENVLSIFAKSPCELIKNGEDRGAIEDFDVICRVGLHGEIMGDVYMAMTLDVIEELAASMLADFPEQFFDSMVQHCLTEVVSLIVGNACTEMMNRGINAMPMPPIYYPQRDQFPALKLSNGSVQSVRIKTQMGDISLIFAVERREPIRAEALIEEFEQSPDVLIVDDSVFTRTIIRNILRENGYTSSEASDGSEALNQYRKVKPKLVFMDITMPNLGGVQAVRKIKEMDENARVIIVSAVANSRVIREVLKEGVLDFVAKPFDSTDIVKILKCYL